MLSVKKITIICYAVTFLVFLIILLWGVFGSITGDELGYSLFNFYLIMPTVSFVMALVIGMKNAYLKWLYPVIFGALGVAIPSLVFRSMDLISLFFSFVPALTGLGIGLLVWRFRTNKNEDKEK